MPTEHEIREFVMKMTKGKVKGFYATYVQKQMKADLQLVQKVLIELVDEGLLIKQYELICSNDHCLRTLDEQLSVHEFESSYDCKYCGEEIEEVDPALINLRFLINRNVTKTS